MSAELSHLSPIIDDQEKIVRAVQTPSHFKDGKLKGAAFRPKPHSNVVSAIRQIMGDDFCKDKSKEIHKDGYVGMAVISAAILREHGCEVVDDPKDYVGHAHIAHETPAPPPNDPLHVAENERFIERCRALAKAAKFHIDPAPSEPGWSGEPL